MRVVRLYKHSSEAPRDVVYQVRRREHPLVVTYVYRAVDKIRSRKTWYDNRDIDGA